MHFSKSTDNKLFFSVSLIYSHTQAFSSPEIRPFSFVPIYILFFFSVYYLFVQMPRASKLVSINLLYLKFAYPHNK